MLCWGFPWKIPQAALDVPRLASVNCHPALLPRHRGPIPLAWALRDGDAAGACTWHYMDAELDTGNTLVQGTVPIEDDDVDIAEFSAKLQANAVALLPRALERVAAGDPGDLQPTEGASWAGHFEDDDYVHVDWYAPARSIHNQVRAWHLTFGMSGLRAPVAELDGEQVVLLQTRLTDPGGGCAPRRVRRRPDLGRRQRARLARSRRRRRPSAARARCRAGCGRRSRAARAGAPSAPRPDPRPGRRRRHRRAGRRGDGSASRLRSAIEPRITTSSTPAPGSPSTCSWRSNSFVKNTETSA